LRVYPDDQLDCVIKYDDPYLLMAASKTIMIKLLNFDHKNPKIFIDPTIDYQVGNNPAAQLVISKIINLRALLGSGNMP